MDWLFWQWEDTSSDGLSDLLCDELVRPSAAELLVIKLTYEAIAGLSNCGKCGASLNRPLRLSSGPTRLRHSQGRCCDQVQRMAPAPAQCACN